MIDFIVNNSTWFIVGGVLIILVVIGYVVDKKGLNKPVPTTIVENDEEKPKEVEIKKEKDKKKKDVVDMDIPFVPDESKKEDTVEENKETKEDKEESKEEITSLDEYSTKPNDEIDSSALDGYTVEEDLTVPFGDPVNVDNEEIKEEKIETLDEKLEQPIEDKKEEKKETKKEENDDIWSF